MVIHSCNSDKLPHTQTCPQSKSQSLPPSIYATHSQTIWLAGRRTDILLIGIRPWLRLCLRLWIGTCTYSYKSSIAQVISFSLWIRMNRISYTRSTSRIPSFYCTWKSFSCTQSMYHEASTYTETPHVSVSGAENEVRGKLRVKSVKKNQRIGLFVNQSLGSPDRLHQHQRNEIPILGM